MVLANMSTPDMRNTIINSNFFVLTYKPEVYIYIYIYILVDGTGEHEYSRHEEYVHQQ